MASFNFYQPATLLTWTITHNLKTKFVAIDTMRLVSGGVYEKVMPTSIQIINDNVLSVKFLTPQIGRARVVAPNYNT